MNRILTNLHSIIMAAAMGMGGVCAAQQGNLELLELKTTLEASARRINDLEVQLAAQRAQNAAVTQSLNSVTNEANQSRESYEKLRGLMEGLGVSALDASGDQTRERMIAALSDLRLVDEQKRKLSEALVALSEASLSLVKASQGTDPAVVKKLDDALAIADQAIRSSNAVGGQEAAPTDLHQAKVVALKADAGVAVLNVGSQDGVKIGMPFAVFRQDKPVAKVMVVDVRKSVSGVVVQQLASSASPVQIGDRGAIDTERNF
jgi:hypothetical protein